eukprot:809762-Alexandrium_andersonii.AAC.1
MSASLVGSEMCIRDRLWQRKLRPQVCILDSAAPSENASEATMRRAIVGAQHRTAERVHKRGAGGAEGRTEATLPGRKHQSSVAAISQDVRHGLVAEPE